MTDKLPSAAPDAAFLDDRIAPGRFGQVAIGAALVLALATFVVFAGLTPIIPTNLVVWSIFASNALVILVLLVLIGLELRRLMAARRAGRAGARLHSRVVVLFSVVAAIPALVTAVVATVSLERVINPAFMQDIGSFIGEAGQVSQRYREAQCRDLLRDTELTAKDLARSARLLQSDHAIFQSYLDDRAKILGLAVAAIMKSDGSLVETAAQSDANLIAKPEAADFADAAKQEATCGLLAQGNAYVVLRPIEGLSDRFFYAARPLDPMSIKMSGDAAAVGQTFKAFESGRRRIETGFAIVFALLALTMLFSAIWMGLAFANRLVGPIRRLIRAADAVAAGDLTVQVPTHRSEGDLGHLSQTFNSMTQELHQQQGRLIAATAQNEERRAFTEAVLSGVPAGVLGVDAQGVISVSNAAAERLLDAEPGALNGRRINELWPELAQTLAQARSLRLRMHHGQVKLQSGGRERLLNVRVTSNPQEIERGSVITLDDISELVSAQRTAAWADVARRIAHEIKNPLTPIQLSAERLKRRYSKLIVEGRDVFDQCTDTIIRQVDDIKRMVDEFSSFARMPRARLANDDMTDCVRQALFLMRVGRSDVNIEDQLPATPMIAAFDRRLISQALTNVIKNACEGIDGREPTIKEPGRLLVSLTRDPAGDIVIKVADNGKGFPAQDRNKLFEPYVTTRAEGTGLGLPIVIKIFEDHHGGVELLDGLKRIDGGFGAQVVMKLPMQAAAAPPPNPSDPKRMSEKALLS